MAESAEAWAGQALGAEEGLSALEQEAEAVVRAWGRGALAQLLVVSLPFDGLE